jgi:tetratricopeptide (TPR) repeat protein
MRKICLSVFLAFMLTFVLITTTQAQTSQESLSQYISDLQKSPNDNALREKIIKFVQTMKATPAIPEEARKYMNRGMAAAESAKTENDFKDAIEEFQKAVNIAPWLGIGYRNLAVMQDKGGQYSQALQNLRLYFLTNPSAADAEAAKSLMDKIEYRQEKAAKESSPEAIAEKKRQEAEVWLRKLDGAQYTAPFQDICSRSTLALDINGKEITYSDTLNWQSESNCNPGAWVGKRHVYYTSPVTNMYIQDGKLILELGKASQKYIVNANDTITQCLLYASGEWKCSYANPFTRKR